MRAAFPIQEYDRLASRVRLAWVCLNRAGDTPCLHRSILDLQSALDGVLSVDAALHGDSTLESAVARHHHSLLGSQRNAPEILLMLWARAREIRLNPEETAENTSDALLAHSAIPVVWRMIRSVRHELRSRRPPLHMPESTRRLARNLHGAAGQVRRHAGMVLALAAAGILLAYIGWFAHPQGCWIAYGTGNRLDSIRGWSAASSLVKDYGTGRPLPWMRRDGWSARWQGLLLVPESAEYSFFAQCSGGLRLWIDGRLLIDDWHSAGWRQGKHAMRLLAKSPHSLQMDFRDCGGPSALRVRWTGGPIPPNTAIGAPYLRKY